MTLFFRPAARVAAIFSVIVMGTSVAPSAVADRAAQTGNFSESYKLPISPPRDQGDSDLCWVFATLNMLETNFRVRHPGSQIEFSPGALQRHAIADRLRRLASGESHHLDDGGLAVEALALIREHGLVARSDYDDLINSEPVYGQFSRRAANGPDDPTWQDAVAVALGPTPVLTHLDGAALAPADLARAVLGERTWTEYDLAADGRERIGPSTDPDARPETRVHYAPLSKLIDLIHASLKRGEAVVWGSTDHALLIFGADYDADGAPVAYWVKDSEPPYVTRTPADELHKALNDVTVTDPPTATAGE